MKSLARNPSRMKVVLRLMRAAHTPTTISLLVSGLFLALPPDVLRTARYKHVEYFAGAHEVTNAWTNSGDAATALDVKFGPSNDINGHIGFLKSVTRLLQVRAFVIR